MELSCIVIDDEPHAVEELIELIELTPGICASSKFNDQKSALHFLKEHGRVDIIFSDINMQSLNGIEAGTLLKKHCDFLIYVTAHKEFALDAFGVNADGYLVKPVNFKTFKEKMELFINIRNETTESVVDDNILFLKGTQKNTFVKVKYTDIIYIEAMLNYVMIHLVNSREIVYMGLSAMEMLLASRKQFFRISKSIIISVDHLDRLEGNIVRLNNKSFFSVGEKYRDAFHNFFRKRILNKPE